jgi:hypothetical protein
MNEGEILVVTGFLALIGGVFMPMVMGVVLDDPFGPSHGNWRKWLVGIAIFMMLPFVYRVWVAEIVN